MDRPKFATRSIKLVGTNQVGAVLALIKNLPIDAENPLEVVIREWLKPRKPDQNRLMWSGPLRDIAEQAWIDGRQFCEDTLHYYFKVEYLPDETTEDVTGLVNDNYKKFDIDPKGNRVLVGSTTDLTVKGFSIYLEQIYAYGASLGVMFSANESKQ